jgi:hypothetical protein
MILVRWMCSANIEFENLDLYGNSSEPGKQYKVTTEPDHAQGYFKIGRFAVLAFSPPIDTNFGHPLSFGSRWSIMVTLWKVIGLC